MKKDWIGVAILGLILLGIMFGMIYLVGAGLLTILGFEYDSYKAVTIFFVIYFMIGTPIEFLCRGILKVISEIRSFTKKEYRVVEFGIDFCTNVTVMMMVDSMVKGVTIPTQTIILFVIIFYVLEKLLEEKLDRKDQINV